MRKIWQKNIKLIGENEQLYQKLSEGARRRYEKFFHREAMIDKALELYGMLLTK